MVQNGRLPLPPSTLPPPRCPHHPPFFHCKVLVVHFLIPHVCYSIVSLERRISGYKCVNTRNIMIVNKTQPVLLSQPILKGKHTLCAQIALSSFGANRLSKIINNIIVTPCSDSLAIRQSPSKTGHLTQQWKPPRFKG